MSSDSVPIPAPGIGTRISALADLLGTRKNAATAMGVSVDSLQRYIRDENMPPFDAAARLCFATGSSLEALATGVEPEAPEGQVVPQVTALSQSLRHDDLILAFQLVEEGLEGRTSPPQQRAEMVSLVYKFLGNGLPAADVVQLIKASGGK